MTDLTPQQRTEVHDIALDTALHIAGTVSKHRIRSYAKGALVGFVILLAGVGLAFREGTLRANGARDAIVRSGSVIAVDGCNRDFRSISNLRGIIDNSRTQLKSYERDGTISHEQYLRGLAEIDKQLKTYPLPDCRKADDVLTANPNKVPEAPVPLHP